MSLDHVKFETSKKCDFGRAYGLVTMVIEKNSSKKILIKSLMKTRMGVFIRLQACLKHA